MWAAQRQLHHGKPTCVAGGCVSGALCTSHRQLRPRVTSPWPTVAYWLYNCGAQPVSLVRFWVCGVLRNSRNTPQGSVSVTSKYLYNMYFLHLLNKCVSPPSQFLWWNTPRKGFILSHISRTHHGRGGWSVWVLKQLGHIEFTPGKPRPVHTAAQLPSLHLCCLESQLGNGATQSGQVFPSISINTVKTTPPKACPEASLFSPTLRPSFNTAQIYSNNWSTK